MIKICIKTKKAMKIVDTLRIYPQFIHECNTRLQSTTLQIFAHNFKTEKYRDLRVFALETRDFKLSNEPSLVLLFHQEAVELRSEH